MQKLTSLVKKRTGLRVIGARFRAGAPCSDKFKWPLDRERGLLATQTASDVLEPLAAAAMKTLVPFGDAKTM